ncbi:hypothetical protein [Nostocoides sp. HKS02]|uniref:hypothetical protein n=1 Tax=Nostocoides sp. HKS02 TaxID=1813880 RepID=UPI0012B4614E|nr:hypothetical protein [Tetrasphaera sp. HKS02]QGN57511.1 hypothetical protein GKE56_06095 [Tetrasphaera sp. HKS02]
MSLLRLALCAGFLCVVWVLFGAADARADEAPVQGPLRATATHSARERLTPVQPKMGMPAGRRPQHRVTAAVVQTVRPVTGAVRAVVTSVAASPATAARSALPAVPTLPALPAAPTLPALAALSTVPLGVELPAVPTLAAEARGMLEGGAPGVVAATQVEAAETGATQAVGVTTAPGLPHAGGATSAATTASQPRATTEPDGVPARGGGDGFGVPWGLMTTPSPVAGGSGSAATDLALTDRAHILPHPAYARCGEHTPGARSAIAQEPGHRPG